MVGIIWDIERGKTIGCRGLEVVRAHAQMVFSGMMLAHLVHKICTAGTMIYNELALADFVANPKEAYIHGFG